MHVILLDKLVVVIFLRVYECLQSPNHVYEQKIVEYGTVQGSLVPNQKEIGENLHKLFKNYPHRTRFLYFHLIPDNNLANNSAKRRKKWP